MKKYLIAHGVKATDILIESRAKNTVANIMLTKSFIPPESNIVVITSDFHLNRAKAICDRIFGHNYNFGYIGSSEEPEKLRKDKLTELYINHINYPYHALEQAMVNDIIDPRDTRPVLIRTLKDLANKEPLPRPWRKHSLIPQ